MRAVRVALTNKVISTTEGELFGLSGDDFGFSNDLMGFLTPESNAFFTSIGGRFYYDEAPQIRKGQKQNYPYCVYFFINEGYEFQFVEEYERVLIQFNIYSDSYSATEAEIILQNLKDLFDWGEGGESNVLTVVGYNQIFFRRDFVNIERFDTDKVWQVAVQYTLMMEKDR